MSNSTLALIISTCGTSLLTNRSIAVPPSCINQYTNCKTKNDIDDPSHRQELEKHLADREKTLLGASSEDSQKYSAELNGILAFGYELAGSPIRPQDQHILLHTDTWLGTQTAKILEKKLHALNANASIHCVPDLNTASLEQFHQGLNNLVEWVAQTTPGYRDKKSPVIFNLVGGFKSVQGFMQTLGMFYADEILYIFETGGQLLRVPTLPVDLDAAAQESIRQHLPTLRHLATVHNVPANIPESFPETFLYRIEDLCDLSPWGNLMWNASKKKIYEENLHPSWSPRVQFTAKFEEDARKLPAKQFLQLNNRIDDLTRYMHDSKANLNGLDVKQLKGNPMPPSTHEADAWANADCKRLFFHFDTSSNTPKAAIIDRLADPLH